jgi:excisionase family DNA binding protein
MNLADAIRRAAQAAGHFDPYTETAFEIGTVNGIKGSPELKSAMEPAVYEDLRRPNSVQDSLDGQGEPDEEVEVMFLRSGAVLSSGEAPQAPVVPANAVRLELFLAPEQVGSLMRSVFATQHSIMTLREAAHFLRIPGANLEQLATEKSVPAFQVDGKWRFSRVALDEWLVDQGRMREA